MIELKKWPAPKTAPLLILTLALLLAPIWPAQATQIKGLRIGNNKGCVRMVLEFDRSPIPSPSYSITHNRLQVTLTGVVSTLATPLNPANREGIARLDLSATSGETNIEALFKFTPSDVKSFTLASPHRFIIDACRPWPLEKAPQTPSAEKRAVLPDPTRVLPRQASAGMPAAVLQASLDAYDAITSPKTGTATAKRNRIRQQLIAALIVVTSIIVVLLFILIWIGSNRGHLPGQPWREHFPPTIDPKIESIDSEIREHLKSYDHM